MEIGLDELEPLAGPGQLPEERRVGRPPEAADRAPDAVPGLEELPDGLRCDEPRSAADENRVHDGDHKTGGRADLPRDMSGVRPKEVR